VVGEVVVLVRVDEVLVVLLDVDEVVDDEVEVIVDEVVEAPVVVVTLAQQFQTPTSKTQLVPAPPAVAGQVFRQSEQ